MGDTRMDDWYATERAERVEARLRRRIGLLEQEIEDLKALLREPAPTRALLREARDVLIAIPTDLGGKAAVQRLCARIDVALEQLKS